MAKSMFPVGKQTWFKGERRFMQNHCRFIARFIGFLSHILTGAWHYLCIWHVFISIFVCNESDRESNTQSNENPIFINELGSWKNFGGNALTTFEGMLACANI
jgi:hypothetical protein